MIRISNKKVSKCGICGVAGHNAQTCPSKYENDEGQAFQPRFGVSETGKGMHLDWTNLQAGESMGFEESSFAVGIGAVFQDMGIHVPEQRLEDSIIHCIDAGILVTQSSLVNSIVDNLCRMPNEGGAGGQHLNSDDDVDVWTGVRYSIRIERLEQGKKQFNPYNLRVFEAVTSTQKTL